jgi:thiol-disulfide isomerase/thioredoxin
MDSDDRFFGISSVYARPDLCLQPAYLRYLLVVVVMSISVTGCSAFDALRDSPDRSANQNEEEAPAAGLNDTNMGVDVDDDAMDVLAVERPAWQNHPLTDARSGEIFTLGGFEGKTVFVETMATWCGNCRQQLTNLRDARAQIAADDIVYIGLSVETNISDEALARYADNAGFDWTFAVIPVDLLRQLADEFGRTITSAPATPSFFIYADGSFSELSAGRVKSTQQLVELLNSARGG